MTNKNVELKFINKDAAQKETIIFCDRPSAEEICKWYGAWCSGDDYKVYINSKQVDIDSNGELVPFIIEA